MPGFVVLAAGGVWRRAGAAGRDNGVGDRLSNLWRGRHPARPPAPLGPRPAGQRSAGDAGVAQAGVAVRRARLRAADLVRAQSGYIRPRAVLTERARAECAQADAETAAPTPTVRMRRSCTAPLSGHVQIDGGAATAGHGLSPRIWRGRQTRRHLGVRRQGAPSFTVSLADFSLVSIRSSRAPPVDPALRRGWSL